MISTTNCNSLYSSQGQKWKQNLLRNWRLYVLLLPAFIYLFIFNYIPMYGVQIAFRDYVAKKGIWG